MRVGRAQPKCGLEGIGFHATDDLWIKEREKAKESDGYLGMWKPDGWVNGDQIHDYTQLKRVFEIFQSPHALRQYCNESNERCTQRPFDVGSTKKQQMDESHEG